MGCGLDPAPEARHILASDRGQARPSRLLAVVALHRSRRDITFSDVVRERRAVALVRVAEASSARALQEEAITRAHFNTRGRRSLQLLRRAEPDHEAGA